MNAEEIKAEINIELDAIYTPTEKLLWWKRGQPLFDHKLPDALIEEGRGDEVLRVVRCLNDGAYI